MNQLKAISISYKHAPLHVRELFAFDEKLTKKILTQLRERFDLNDAILISTCNRTEIYYNATVNINSDLIQFIASETEFSQYDNIATYFVSIEDSHQTATYLFEVALGLHSQVLGDLQITGQVKNAYQWAADVNMAGPVLHRIMHAIFFTNKRVVQETHFRDGAASVSYAATELIDTTVHSDTTKKIGLIGTGEIGRDTAKNLIDFGYTNITICNRTLDNAYQLAAQLQQPNVKVEPLSAIKNVLADCDIIISAVQAESPIITAQMLEGFPLLTHKYFFDLSVPRSIHPDVEKIPGVILYNVEDISRKTNEAAQLRLQAVPMVQQIIAEAMADFSSWAREMEFSPVIHKIKQALEHIRIEELDRYNKQLSEQELKMVDTITRNIMQKVIKLPVVQLKAACKRGDAESLAEVLQELFDLERQKELK